MWPSHRQPSGFGGDPCLAIEINCTGRRNGLGTDGTSNGSSSHGADVIRMNCAYPDNLDRTVHDITQGAPAQTWNMGCAAGGSQSGKSNWACGISVGDASIMWLDGCTSYGGPTDIETLAAASTVYVANFTGAGSNTGSGTIASYTP